MLMVIIGNVDSGLNELPVEHPLRERLLEVRDAARRSADLTGGLLAFARKQVHEPKQLDINLAIDTTLDLLLRLIGSRIEIDWRPAADVWPVRLDASQLDQILNNLVVNARDAIEHNGVISIVTQNGGRIRLHSELGTGTTFEIDLPRHS